MEKIDKSRVDFQESEVRINVKVFMRLVNLWGLAYSWTDQEYYSDHSGEVKT